MDSVARSIYSALLALAFYCMISEFIFKDEERSGSFFGVSFAQCSGLLKQSYIWGQRMFSSFGYISMFLQLTLTLNRFLALSFDGRYFHRVQQHERLQVLVPCLIGFVTKEWLEKLFGVRITLVAATISLDFMLIYKMLTNVYLLKKAMKRGLERASRRALVQRACSDTQSCSTSKK
ncbi:unnamed protein product, partial [Mesorhabditis belari]|uniref:Uncharacterized protein n=1 Tax=Mesorhabditis belari TaxID=2138241 RepID=A0AAF3EKA6_9BILA